MKKSNYALLTALMILIVGMQAFAENPTENAGESVAFVKTNPADNNSNSSYKQIKFQKVILSPEEKQRLMERVQALDRPSQKMTPQVLMAVSPLPSSVQLGMNGVPVLDQGLQGTCGTFAAVAALDALYGHGDYISQVCYLQVSRSNEDDMGAWNGALDSNVLADLQEKGVISMQYQEQHGCGHLYEYPANIPFIYGDPVTSEFYEQHSEKIFSHLILQPIFYADGENDMQRLKTALSQGHRVVIDMYLDAGMLDAGAHGYYHSPSFFSPAGLVSTFMDAISLGNGDAYILTPEIKQDLMKGLIQDAHAVVVTGYDDDAVITGPGTIQHKGVLTLRNSWGSLVGDHGDYYMSYDYYEMMVYNATEISLPG